MQVIRSQELRICGLSLPTLFALVYVESLLMEGVDGLGQVVTFTPR